MKTLRNYLSLLRISILACLFLPVVGCEPDISSWTVEVIPMEGLKTASVEVDLVGATEREKAYWESVDMNQYWKFESTIRKEADKYTLRLDDGKPKTLDLKDPIWKKWLDRGVRYVVVLAHLPGDQQGIGRDPRREVLSLAKQAWITKQPVLQIDIHERIIQIITPEKIKRKG